MKKEWVLTQEAFDGLLDWLAADRESAGIKYETIRLRLMKIFICRGCGEAEDLADETINRVARKVPEIAKAYTGDPALYFYGVAQRVHLEYLRRPPLEPVRESFTSGDLPLTTETIEAEFACLEECMDRLPSVNQRLVLQYYQEEKQAKIDRRKVLASELGIAVNALRIRAHRIRLTLQLCVQDCLERGPVH